MPCQYDDDLSDYVLTDWNVTAATDPHLNDRNGDIPTDQRERARIAESNFP